MTKSKALASVQARLTAHGFIKWLSPERPDALDLIALLGYWPQLRRAGRKPLDPKEAKRFLLNLGYVEVKAPREYLLEGPGTLGWSHPNGDEYGAQIALDILEGRMSVDVQQRRAQHDAARLRHETLKLRNRRTRR